MTQGNSIAGALHSTFSVPTWVTGIVITVVSLLIIVGGIKSISKVSSIVVPVMAIFYVICGMIVILGNTSNLPSGLAMIFKMAFSVKAVWWWPLRFHCCIYDECDAIWCCTWCVFK